MKKITVSFAVLAAIIAMTIPQACVGTAGTQCAKPTLIPSDAIHATTSVTVTIATATAGAYLRYTLDGSTPTGGSSGNGTQIAAASGKVSFTVGPREKTLKAVAYKSGLVDSLIDAVGPDGTMSFWKRESLQRGSDQYIFRHTTKSRGCAMVTKPSGTEYEDMKIRRIDHQRPAWLVAN